MSTSGGGPVNAVLYVGLVGLALGLARHVAGVGFRPAVQPAGLALWLLVAVPSLLQLGVPALLEALEREPSLVARGQVWRVLTSGVVQDGGMAGTVSNLVLLLVVAAIAGPVWGGARMWVVVVVAQLVFGLWTALVFPSTGAGNSALTLALAASVAGLGFGRRGAGVVLAAAAVIIGVALVALLDAHGVAVLAGVAIGAVIGAVSPPRPADERYRTAGGAGR